MELIPELKIGWLNGWLPVVILGITDGVLFLSFPKEVVHRLWDRSGWSPQQRAATLAGKLSALACLVLLALTPLKIGRLVFWIGSLLVVFGLVGLVRALLDFRNTPPGVPVRRGLYRISRHPQIVMASLVLLGACIAVGSWLAVGFWAVARLLEHLGIVAEEEICLRQYGEAYAAYLKQAPRYFLFF
jgi:protein-S-isoprenylcysteine O-methyltransferase Ste14